MQTKIAGIFSCFTNIKISDVLKDGLIKSSDNNLKYTIKMLEDNYYKYSDIESKKQIYTGFDYDICYDMIQPVIEWFLTLLMKMERNKLFKTLRKIKTYYWRIYKGNHKINNIATEFESFQN